MYIPIQNKGDCLAEIAECRKNQQMYPEHKDLALMGELDWTEEHLLSGGKVEDIIRLDDDL